MGAATGAAGYRDWMFFLWDVVRRSGGPLASCEPIFRFRDFLAPVDCEQKQGMSGFAGVN